MFSDSLKEINRLRKEIGFNKRNVKYLKVTRKTDVLKTSIF